MKKNNLPLINWSHKKDILPFLNTDEWPKYSCRKPEYKFLDRKKDIDFINSIFNQEKICSLGLYLDLWHLHLIERPEVSTLLNPVYLEQKGEIIYNYFEISEKMKEMKIISSNKPFKVYLSHYLPEIVEASIFPLVKHYPHNGDYPFFMLGYIAWQISKIYEEIFEKNYEKNGSSKDDLSFYQLSHFYFMGENKITINLDS